MQHEEQRGASSAPEQATGTAERIGGAINRSWLSPVVSGIGLGFYAGVALGLWAGIGFALFFFLCDAARLLSQRGHFRDPAQVERRARQLTVAGFVALQPFVWRFLFGPTGLVLCGAVYGTIVLYGLARRWWRRSRSATR